MPTVNRGDHGYCIVSSRRGRFITHQLSAEGVTFLRQRHERIDGLEIDVRALLQLKDLGYAETGSQRKRRERLERRSARPPAPVVEPKPEAVRQPTVVCNRCKWEVVKGAFCAHCGAPLFAGAAPPAITKRARHDSLTTGIVVIIIVVVLLIAALK